MKTLRDVEMIKLNAFALSGNVFSEMITRLANYYLSKWDGLEIIAAKLSSWDDVSKKHIVDCVLIEININILSMGYFNIGGEALYDLI